MGTSTIMFDMPTAKVSLLSGFSLFQKVSIVLFIQFVLYLNLNMSLAERKYKDDDRFRMFRHQLFHSSLGAILEPLRPAMTTPDITRCPDRHFCRVIYGIGPYIADYPEQALLASIVNGWCPK